MNSKNKGLKLTTAFGALVAGVAAISSPALAQNQTPNQPASNSSSSATSEDDDNGDEIVVTGSRIHRTEFTSASPIQVITAEQNTLEGMVDTSQILQGSPIASGSAQINNQFGGFVVNGGTGVNNISLRGLGANRTLVLLNGRRVSGAGTRGGVGAVDTNVLPESMIERIEILKDGASSIYGSDAVAGVVNIITRDDLDGGIVEGTANISEHGGAENYQINGVWGRTFDRGHFMVGAEYFEREELTRGDRDFLGCAQDLVTMNGSYTDIIDPSTGESKCFNLLFNVADRLVSGGRYVYAPGTVNGTGPFSAPPPGGTARPNLTNYQRLGLSWREVANSLYGFSTNSATFPSSQTGTNAVYNAMTQAQRDATWAAWRASQGAVPNNFPAFASSTAINPVERTTLFALGSFDLTSNAELYAELLYNRRESSTHRYRQLFPNVNGANPDNPFGQTARSILAVPTNDAQSVDFYRAVAGVRGDIADWDYDIYYMRGSSDGEYTNDIIYNDRVLATTGAVGCTTTPAGGNISGFDCSIGQVRYFTALANGGQLSAAEQAFLFTRETGHTTYDMDVVSGSVTGNLFSLPAGEVGSAWGFEWRREAIDDTPGFNARNGNLWGQTSAGRTKGSDEVRELFGEVEVPLIANSPFAESVTANASYRWTDYDSYGDDSTYAFGLNWQITSEYRLRATTGTSFRAPALTEMFLANQTGFLGQTSIDPCIQWDTSANAQIVASCGPGGLGLPTGYTATGYSSALIQTGGGGPGVLNAETSDAYTVGAIWTPDWLPLNVAIDYWDIEVNNQVAQFGAANIIAACHNEVPFGSSPFCSLFVRDSNPASPTFGRIDFVNNSYVNLNSQATRGIDLTLRFEKEFSFGTFRIDSQATWTLDDQIDFFTAAVVPNPPPPNDFNGEAGDPDFTASVDLRFDRGDWTYYWDVDLVARTSNDEAFGGQFFGWRSTPTINPATGTPDGYFYKQSQDFYTLHSASIRYRSDNWAILAGIQNVFDEEPPVCSTGGCFRTGNAGNFSQYDWVGRRYWVSLSRSW